MRYSIVACLLLFGSLVYGESFKASAVLDTSTILIGDQVWLRLEVERDARTIVGWPVWSDSLAASVEILKVDSIKTSVLPDGNVRYSQQLLLTSFDSGTHVVPPVAWLVESDSVRDTVFSAPLALNVQTIPVDMEKGLKDIKPVFEIPVTLAEVLPWFIGGCLVVLLIILVWRFVRYRTGRTGLFTSKPKLPPHVVALNSLELLKAADLWQQGQYKEYHTRLTDILRIYFEDQFGISALEMTSDDLLLNLKKSKLFTPESQGRLRFVFSCADLAKFAKYMPLEEENETSWRYAHDFVLETRPAPAEDPEAPLSEPSDPGNSPTEESLTGRTSS